MLALVFGVPIATLRARWLLLGAADPMASRISMDDLKNLPAET